MTRFTIGSLECHAKAFELHLMGNGESLKKEQ